MTVHPRATAGPGEENESSLQFQGKCLRLQPQLWQRHWWDTLGGDAMCWDTNAMVYFMPCTETAYCCQTLETEIKALVHASKYTLRLYTLTQQGYYRFSMHTMSDAYISISTKCWQVHFSKDYTLERQTYYRLYPLTNMHHHIYATWAHCPLFTGQLRLQCNWDWQLEILLQGYRTNHSVYNIYCIYRTCKMLEVKN